MAQQRARPTRRVWLPAAFFGAFALLVGARLVQVQVFEHQRYASLAEHELLGGDQLWARRGAILDRNGTPLAASVDSWDVYVNSRVWRDAGVAEASARGLADLLGQPAEAIRARVAGSGDIDVLLERDVEYEAGRLLLERGLAGVIALPNTVRVYPEDDLGAVILGFIGQENTGLTGLEAAYNEVLAGKPGRAIYERSSTGQPIPFGNLVREAPTPGRDIVLTIDRYLQQLAERALDAAIEKHRATGGTVIILDPATGEVLAMASQPGLRYSALDLGNAGQTALFRSRAVTDLYEPGSVMKVVTAAAAIDRGVVSPGTTYVDSGVSYVHGVPIRNWDFNVYGTQTMTSVLQHSINTGAIFMVQALGAEAFHGYLQDFGFGRPTGIDLSGEAAGIVRRPRDPGWSPVDLATQAFGQSISATPIQMAVAIAAAINGGNLLTPRLVKAFVDVDGVRTEVKTEVRGHPITAVTSATIRQMLRDVVDPGWFHPGKPEGYTAGGKSGTANVPVPNGYDERSVASFVGFAPFENPRILVYVKIDENEDLLTGTQAAGPVFAQLVEDSLYYLNVRPDDPKLVSAP